MINLMQRIDGSYRGKLLATASMLALLSVTSTKAESADHPTLWIELGSQFEQVGGGQEPFAPPFATNLQPNGFSSPLPLEKALSWSYGGAGEIVVQPNGSDWFLKASVRYGRAVGRKSLHQQTKIPPVHIHFRSLISATETPVIYPYAETKTRNNESHTILDFQVGKDVGLGLFGRSATSQIEAGLRFAQFQKRSHTSIYANPSAYLATNLKYYAHYARYAGINDEKNSFHGIGPMLSWNASASIIGNEQDGEIDFDWGVNAAVLFGKQKAAGTEEVTGNYYRVRVIPAKFVHTSYQTVRPHDRSHAVTVPNVGAFAGFSLKWPNAKLSVGYRVDAFFGAMDGGIDTRKTYDRDFYGPFAAVSIGLGG